MDTTVDFYREAMNNMRVKKVYITVKVLALFIRYRILKDFLGNIDDNMDNTMNNTWLDIPCNQ